MEEGKKLIRFDWAMKRLLRDKANFEVLEGFLTTLLEKPIKIDRILESESNQDFEDSKFNRVDILAESSNGEKMLIEVQNQSEIAYFHRMLFGTARLISEYTKLGDDYGTISRIYSINIVYFRLGEGDDTVYVGETVFKGIHNGDTLKLSKRWQEKLKVPEVKDIFPVYYILRVNNFDKWSKTPLDQWLYFLSQGDLKENADAPGMDAVKKKLQFNRMSRDEQVAYRKKMDDITSIRNGYQDALEQGIAEGRAEGRAEGLEQGRAEGLEQGRNEGLEQGRNEGLEQGRNEGLEQGRNEGLEQGRAEGILEIALQMHKAGIPHDTIIALSGLTARQLDEAIKNSVL